LTTHEDGRIATGGATRELYAAATALIPDVDCAIGVSGSLLEPLAIVGRSPGLNASIARRFLHYGVIEGHRSASLSSFVPEVVEEAGYSALLACVFRDRRLGAVIAYIRRVRRFSNGEIETLRDGLSALDLAFERHATSTASLAAAQRIVPTLCVLRPDLTVECASPNAPELGHADERGGGRLPADVEARVRAAIADWGADVENCPAKVTQTEDGRSALRVFPLGSPAGLRIAVMWEPVRREAPLLRSVERYGLTLREVQILNLLAGGCSSGEVASRLGIAESTVNEHIMRMMQKTEATNRVELVATTMVGTER
jgi:DNA-binding CsgD family transcriptional regulator